MKKYLLYILPVFFAFALKAQPTPTITVLRIGDQMPAITINDILNYSSTSVKTADYKGKLLILDFWATWCSTCLVHLRDYGALSKEFGSKLFILPVTNEPADKIKKFYKSRAGFNFPTVYGDKQLSELFPHTALPHYVWIGPTGTVLAITSGDAINPQNIREMVENPKVKDWQVKADLDRKKPLFLSDDFPRDNEILNYTIFSKGHYTGLPRGNQFRRTGSVVYGRSMTNMSLLLMYEAIASALFEKSQDVYSRKRLVLSVSDSSKIMQVPGKKYSESPVFNFDMVVPPEQAGQLYEKMLSELNQYSGYTGRIEKRQIDCLVLTRITSNASPATKGGKPENTLYSTFPVRLINAPLSSLLAWLNSLSCLDSPLFDETGITGNIDLHLANAVHNLEELRHELQPTGLDLVRSQKEINVFVLAENANAN